MKDDRVYLLHIRDAINRILRDTLIHRYFGVKLSLVWEVVARDILVLKAKVESLIEATSPA